MAEPEGLDLNGLRAGLDEIDERMLQAIRDRISQCVKIADYKRQHGIEMMQSHRIKAVHDHAEAFATEHGIDAVFLHRLFDAIIQECCRVETEVMGSPEGGVAGSVLSRSALRLDHLAIAVRDLEAAIAVLQNRYGFALTERRRVHGEVSGMDSATMRAGGVTLVLCQGDSPQSNVSQYIEAFGPGVQHIALEVTGQQELIDDLVDRQADLLTKILHAPGLDQAFTRRDFNTGIQFEFVTRTTKTGFDDNNVQELFTAMERENVF